MSEVIEKVKKSIRHDVFKGISFDFTGKVALITGARSGIGLATAIKFAEYGAAVALAGRHEPVAEAQALRDRGFKAISIQADVRIDEDNKRMVEETVKEFGRLDFVFNNAGIMREAKNIEDTPIEEFDDVMNTNFRGLWVGMHYEMEEIKKHGDGGSIVNCGSSAGLVGFAGRSPYTSAKHGISGVTKAVALEAAKYDINVNAIAPGNVWTPMVEQLFEQEEDLMSGYAEGTIAGRLGSAEECAALVLFLCSYPSRYTVGQVIAIDGGYTVQ